VGPAAANPLREDGLSVAIAQVLMPRWSNQDEAAKTLQGHLGNVNVNILHKLLGLDLEQPEHRTVQFLHLPGICMQS